MALVPLPGVPDDHRGAEGTQAEQAASRLGVVCLYCLVEVRPRHAAVSWLSGAYHVRCLDALLAGSPPRQRDEAA